MTDHTELLARHREQWSGTKHHGLTFSDLNTLIEAQAAQLEQERNAHDVTEQRLEQTTAKLLHETRVREKAEKRSDRLQTKAYHYHQRLAAVEAWARDLLVYLDVEVESLPEAEYKIYEEGYDKTIAGLQAALNQFHDKESSLREVEVSKMMPVTSPSPTPTNPECWHGPEVTCAICEPKAK